MSRSTLSLLCLALIVGVGLQHMRSRVFHEEKVEADTTIELDQTKPQETRSIDPQLEAAMSAIVEQKLSPKASQAKSLEDRREVSIASEDVGRDGERMQLKLERAQSLSERAELMRDFTLGGLAKRSDAALEKNIEFIRGELEFISSKYLHKYDSKEFDQYFIDLMKYAYDHQYELNSRDAKSTHVSDKLLKGKFHQEIREKIANYINLGSEDKLN